MPLTISAERERDNLLAIVRELLDACEFQKPYLRLTQRDRITVANKIDPIIAKAKGVLPAVPTPADPSR